MVEFDCSSPRIDTQNGSEPHNTLTGRKRDLSPLIDECNLKAGTSPSSLPVIILSLHFLPVPLAYPGTSTESRRSYTVRVIKLTTGRPPHTAHPRQVGTKSPDAYTRLARRGGN